MNSVVVDVGKHLGKIKPMHAVNNGPYHKEGNQNNSNLQFYKEAGIPYARNHDANHFSGYGGPHTVDVAVIFPDFSKDPYNEENYDFTITDEHIRMVMLAGTEVFYRLGASIEHWVKKYNTLPPADFKKWAVICEHIILHYNYGWADGFNHNITYWEIWNEPDLDNDDSLNKRTWGGTTAQFYEFFEIAIRYLKGKFPNLKIGGPALAKGSEDWVKGFFEYLTRDKSNPVPLDFFSFHVYCYDPLWIGERTRQLRKVLDEYGYINTELNLNEWNYMKGWQKEFKETLISIGKMKGAAFTAACMCVGQKNPLDMLMYYDARPNCSFNGIFSPYTFDRLKGYYPFKMFSELYKKGREIECLVDGENIYAVCAVDEENIPALFISSFEEIDEKKNILLNIEFKNSDCNEYEIYILNEEYDCELVKRVKKSIFEIEINNNEVLMVLGKE